MFDVRWMDSRVHRGGISGLIHDFDLLDSFFEKDNSHAIILRSVLKTISRVLEPAFVSLRNGVRVISYVLFSGLSAIAETDELIARFLHNAKITTPKPYLTPAVSF